MTDTPNRPPLWRVIEDCDTFMPVHGALCPQGEHAPGPEPLSPAAQSVLDAAHAASSWGPDDCLNDAREIAAAALRAAADLARSNPWGARIECAGAMWMRDQLLAIATELKGQQSTSLTH